MFLLPQILPKYDFILTFLEILMVDINMITEGKKFNNLTSVQDLFNITDSNYF